MSIIINNIAVELAELRMFIVNQWQSKILYRKYYNNGIREEVLYKFILSDISDYADGLFYKTEELAQKKLNLPTTRLDWFDRYPKSDVRSIGFALIKFLSGSSGSSIEELTYDDIPAILEFIDTPPDKALEGWAQWEHYWSTIDLAARHQKLLEEIKNAQDDN